jgi:hypothetical protein
MGHFCGRRSRDTEAILEGETYDGIKIRGIDTIRIVKK